MINANEPTRPIKTLFKPLIGEIAWLVRRGHGSFLTLEFGAPHLVVREPIVARRSASARVKRLLARRGVHVTGDWHLWVQYGEWTLTTAGGTLASHHRAGTYRDQCLDDLDGQRLISVTSGRARYSCTFRFDLGGALEVRPSREIPDEQWALYAWTGKITAYGSDGTLVTEMAARRPRPHSPGGA
jgi:hypothetical protein